MGVRDYWVIVVTAVTALTLHTLSSSVVANGGWGSPPPPAHPAEDTQAIAALLQKRATLHDEIKTLQHVVAQLEKIDLTSSLGNAPSTPVAPAYSSPPGAAQYPAAASPPLRLRAAAAPASPAYMTPPATSTYVPPLAPVVRPLADAAPPPAAASFAPAAPVAAAVATAAALTSREPRLLFEGDALPAGLRDFPCALRNFKKAQVTTTCEIDCGDAACGAALAACAQYVECHALVVRSRRTASSLAAASAVLKTDSARSRDDSLVRLQQSPWWGSTALQQAQTPRPRVYVVASYGGSGSKMLSGWLASLPAAYQKGVVHYHDRQPPQQLRHVAKPPAHTVRSRTDFRSGQFKGGYYFKTDAAFVPPEQLDEYRVVFIYKDPVEALVSRYGWGHCRHIQGDCGANEANWPKLDRYAVDQVDSMRLKDHFGAYLHPTEARNYPVVALNYHKLWDNLPAVLAALGLPLHLAAAFPKRTETVRNDATGQAEGNRAHTEATRRGLRQLYRGVVDEVARNPAVLVA